MSAASEQRLLSLARTINDPDITADKDYRFAHQGSTQSGSLLLSWLKISFPVKVLNKVEPQKGICPKRGPVLGDLPLKGFWIQPWSQQFDTLPPREVPPLHLVQRFRVIRV